MSGVEIALIGAAIGGTFLEYQAIKDEGKAQANLLRAQGEAVAKGRQDALNFKEEGIQVLKQINMNMALINAKGGPETLIHYLPEIPEIFLWDITLEKV